MTKHQHIILFDGVCNLCNGAVNFILKRDKNAKFKFAPLQSSVAESYISKAQKHKLDSIVYYEKGNIYIKSTAALKIAKELNGLWKLSYIFIIVPKFIRDFIYDLVAKNRYQWFGKRSTCRLPTKEEKERFLEMN